MEILSLENKNGLHLPSNRHQAPVKFRPINIECFKDYIFMDIYAFTSCGLEIIYNLNMNLSYPIVNFLFPTSMVKVILNIYININFNI